MWCLHYPQSILATERHYWRQMYQITCSFLWNHKRQHYTVFTYAVRLSGKLMLVLWLGMKRVSLKGPVFNIRGWRPWWIPTFWGLDFVWVCKYTDLLKRNKVWEKSGRSAVKLQHATATQLAASSEHDWLRRCKKRTFFLSMHSLYKLWSVQEVERQSQKLSYEMHRKKKWGNPFKAAVASCSSPLLKQVSFIFVEMINIPVRKYH